MVDFSESRVCRHRRLVEYFGQSYEKENCGACDVCCDVRDEVGNSKTLAQMILSCVARVGGDFGAAHIVSILRGENTARVRDRGHDKLSTYGLVPYERAETLRDFIAQLVAAGALQKETGKFPTLDLTPFGREVMLGRKSVALMRFKRSGNDMPADPADVDVELFDQLRAWRRSLADSLGVAPFVLFSDATLRQLAIVRPSSVEKLRMIYGISETKANEHGEAILAMVRAHCEEGELSFDRPLPPPVPRKISTCGSFQKEVAWEAFARGEAIEAVAAQIDRARSTTVEYLADYIVTARPASIEPWVSDAAREEIIAATERFGRDHLKPIYEHLNGRIAYDQIRIVLAQLMAIERAQSGM
jgi:ATP-dependent DNA helicase RecQ